MRKTRPRPSLLSAFAIAVGLSLTVAGCSVPSEPQASSASPTTAGQQGAVLFDEGAISLGSGSPVVDAYLDPLCPYCKLFDQTSGRMLLADATAQKITLRIHPVATLNRYSQGTDYSTRAAAVLTAVAADDPGKVPAFLTALYFHQPPENSPGLTDADLLALVGAVGARIDESNLPAYRTWIDQQTLRAMVGPLSSTTQIASLTQVPTVIVGGDLYTGSTAETDRFAEFYRAHVTATPAP